VNVLNRQLSLSKSMVFNTNLKPRNLSLKVKFNFFHIFLSQIQLIVLSVGLTAAW